MKTLKITITNVMLAMLFLLAGILSTYGQIQMVGNYDDGEGGAGWDADGSGPEPYGDGHEDVFYFLASRDYIDPGYTSGAHCLGNMPGFEAFEQALADNGYTPGQVTFRMGLMSLGEDIQGVDWFDIGDMHYGNWNPLVVNIDLDGEVMVYGTVNYTVCYQGPSTGYNWFAESAYFTIQDVSGFSDPKVQACAQEFLQDMEGMELKLTMRTYYAGADLSGNGRYGGYYDMTGTFEKGLPELPFQGLNSDHEGFAGWDADGTGTEPFGDGHLTQLYYGASLDYDGIDPDPTACLGHFLEGATGFINTLLQLEYRGYEIGDLKVKQGLNCLGPDIMDEDWGYENGNPWCNYYNNAVVFELDGEPILVMLQDTNKLISMPTGWITETGIGKVYDASENASPDAQFVAQSFLRDMGTHYIKTETSNIQYVSLFSGNGRDGALYEIQAGSIVGVHEQATFISEGTVSGVWTPEDSPYYVDGHLTIENGYMLTIQPGVKVAIRGPYHFDVQGCVIAEGNADELINFTHSNPIVWWDGIDYLDTPAENEMSAFDHCIFSYAYAQGEAPGNSGGALAIMNFNNIKITNSTFEFNKADIPAPPWTPSGGAIAIFGSNPLIQKCIFRNNQADDAAAIIVYSDADPIISNCLFYANTAESDAGAIEFNTGGNGILINNTFADNQAENGGAIQVKYGSSPVFINNILWGNEAVTSGNQVRIDDGDSQPDFYYCDIEGGQAEFGGAGFYGDYLYNIDEDPIFMGEPSDHPFMITEGSACIDAGTSDTSQWYSPQYLPETCLAGNPRIYNGRIDIGACEYDPVMSVGEPAVLNHPVTVYPNPFRENLLISINLERSADVKMQVYNTSGSLIASYEYGNMQAGSYLQTWNASAFPEGIYYCRVQIGIQTVTKKIIKMR